LSQETERHKTKAERNSRYKRSTTTKKKGLVTNISFTTRARHKSKRDAIKAIGTYHLPLRLIMQKHFEIFLMMMAQNPMPRQKKKQKNQHTPIEILL
jgi:hypothetical protein